LERAGVGHRYATYEQLIAITGTNGKDHHTRLVESFLKPQETRFIEETSGCRLPISLLDLSESNIVLEVSSYQLENIETFHPPFRDL